MAFKRRSAAAAGVELESITRYNISFFHEIVFLKNSKVVIALCLFLGNLPNERNEIKKDRTAGTLSKDVDERGRQR